MDNPTSSLGGSGYPDSLGNRTRHRQYRIYLGPGGAAAPGAEKPGRTLGLALAMRTRILLLLTLTWIMTLTAPILSVFSNEISGRDIILLAGGLFLLAKSTQEIHVSLEGKHDASKAKVARNIFSVLIQIAILDIVFSLDSVITAVGLADHIPVMILAIVIAVLIMMLSARIIGEFVDTHPTIKMLALSSSSAGGFFPSRRRPESAHPQRLHLFCHGVFAGRRDPQPESQGPLQEADSAAQIAGRLKNFSIFLKIQI